MFSSEQLD